MELFGDDKIISITLLEINPLIILLSKRNAIRRSVIWTLHKSGYGRGHCGWWRQWEVLVSDLFLEFVLLGEGVEFCLQIEQLGSKIFHLRLTLFYGIFLIVNNFVLLLEKLTESFFYLFHDVERGNGSDFFCLDLVGFLTEKIVHLLFPDRSWRHQGNPRHFIMLGCLCEPPRNFLRDQSIDSQLLLMDSKLFLGCADTHFDIGTF